MKRERDRDVQCRRLWEVLYRDVDVVEKAYAYFHQKCKCVSKLTGREKKHIRRIPSSSEDFTFATITSEVKGLNTTILNTTINSLFNGGQGSQRQTYQSTINIHLRISPYLHWLEKDQIQQCKARRRAELCWRIFYLSPR